MTRRCDDAHTLVSKTSQSIVQKPIKVEPRRQWPQRFGRQMRGQSSKREGSKPGRV